MEKIKRLVRRFRRWQYAGLLVLVLVTLGLHLAALMTPPQPVFDENHYIPDARLIMQGEPTQRPEHPPLSKLMIVAGIELFGDNPIGWRLFPVLASSGALVFFYLICRRLKLSRNPSYVATFLLGIENLTFVHGHLAMLDIYATFFMMLAFWLYLKENFVLSGAAIALGAMAKLTGVFVLPVIGLHWVLAGDLVGRWRPAAVSARLKERGKSRFWRPLSWIITALDALVVSLLLGAVWLYYKESYSLFGVEFGLMTLAVSTAVLSILLILMHWVFARIVGDARQQVGMVITGISLGLGRRCFSFWFFLERNWKRIRVLPVAVVAVVVLFGLTPVLDFGVFHGWLNPSLQINVNPFDRIKTMSDIAGQITYHWVDPATGSRPWIWVLTPEVMPYWVVSFWSSPHYYGMISPTLWAFIMPLVLYMVWKAIRGNTQVLLPLCWFLFLYMVWIPISLITDRVTYLFYFYPTVGAIAIGLAIVLAPLLGRAWGRGIMAGYLFLHTVAFVLLSPNSDAWAIPLCLFLWVFFFWYLRLGRGIRLWHRRKPEPVTIDIPQPAG